MHPSEAASPLAFENENFNFRFVDKSFWQDDFVKKFFFSFHHRMREKPKRAKKLKSPDTFGAPKIWIFSLEHNLYEKWL